MAPVIPRYSVFKSKYSDQYLRYLNETSSSKHRYLRSDGSDILSPFSKFSVEKSKKNTNLVHIRSCFSNKYWRRDSQDGYYITAAADKPDEDQSKWSCTLFKPIQAGDHTTIRFQHVQLGYYIMFNRSSVTDRCYLSAESSTLQTDSTDLFNVINWESLVILPKYVVFKGDNGKYLRFRGTYHGREVDNHMEFGSDDIGAIKVSNETFTNFDGSIRLKHDFNGKFWEATPNWIYPISTDASATRSTSFWPVKLGAAGNKNNIIALMNLGNHRFCRRTNYGGTVDCLAAASWATNIDKEAYLEVEEPVVFREVYDIDFNLGDSRIYNEQILVMASDETSNLSETEIKDSALALGYDDIRTSRFDTSLSVKTGVGMGFSVSIPLIGDLQIGLSQKYSIGYEESYNWGEEKKQTNKLLVTIKVVVPPKTKVTVELVATKGFCDIPFSYVQRDTLTSGKQIAYFKDDGVYTGSNYFGFNFVVKDEKISR